MMKYPCHPGALLKDSFGPDGLNLSIAQAARHLGVSRVTLSRVANERASISPELAYRLELAGLSTAHTWLGMQINFDLSLIRNRRKPKVKQMYFPTERAA